MNRLAIGAVALAIAIVAPVSAETTYRIIQQNFTPGESAAGLISADGSVDRGTGFVVVHRGTGKYDIDFKGHFGPHPGCASMVVTGVLHPVIASAVPRVCSPNTLFDVYIYNPATGQLEDEEFQFIASQQFFY